ncbi:MAG: YebC/PmpR family DNA-binding transcriptional regulator [Acidobacteria bacterium]|nr:YebC/PmpR family DNA-binding transcriptional regulator [Acidobacteriota bacterium]
MSGHSKWHTIKHKKAALDAKRGKLFTRLLREVQMAARGGADPEANARLRTAVTAAKAKSVPADNIERAILRGSGQMEGESLEEITFEGYAPAGVAVYIETVTDNRNRTVSEIRHMLGKNGGNLGENGCVGWIFDLRSLIQVPKTAAPEEELMEAALGAGALDMEDDDEMWSITSEPTNHEAVLEAVTKVAGEPESAEITRIPQNSVKVEGKQAAAVLKLLDLLEGHDDVQNVYANFDIDEAELEALSA